VDHGETGQATFTVSNTGNNTLGGIIIEVSDLSDGAGHYITADNISFDPTSIATLASGGSENVTVSVHVPYGTHAGAYTGTITVRDDDGYPNATVTLNVTVNASYDLDIADNGGDVLGNILTLNNTPGNYDTAVVRIVNPNTPEMNVDPDPFGNADFTALTSTVSGYLYNADHSDSIPGDSITVTLPGGLLSGTFADVPVVVHIPAGQTYGDYYGWIKLTGNPGSSSDSIRVKVEVGPQRSLDITNASITVSGDHNSELTVTFDITNNGNAPLYGIQFNSTNLVYNAVNRIPAGNVTFEPNMISELDVGQTATITVHIVVPLGTYAGDYNGTVTAFADGGYPADNVPITVTVNPSYDLDISDNEQNLVGNAMHLAGNVNDTVSGYFRVVNPNSQALNVDENDGPANADLTNITATITDLVSGTDTLYHDSISLVGLPATLASGQAENVLVKVVIGSAQAFGTYTGWIKLTDTESGTPVDADSFQIIVSVGSNEVIDITESAIGVTADHGSYSTEATFTVNNNGNSDLTNIEFYATKLEDGHGHEIPGNLVHFTPPTIDMLETGASYTIHVYVEVPQGTYTGNYEGTITARDNDGWPSDTVHFTVTVNKVADLDIADNLENLSANTMNLNGQQGQTVSARFAVYNPNTDGNNVDPGDGPGNVDLNNLHFESTVLTDNVGHTIPVSNISSNVPSALASGSYYSATLTVTIPANQPSGLYEGYVRVYDGTENVADTFMLRVNVGVTEDIDIENTLVQGTGDHGSSVTLSKFVVWNTDNTNNPDPDGPGNVALDNLQIEVSNLYSGTYVIPSSAVSFNPSHIGYLPIGAHDSVTTTVIVPAGQHAGTYTGVIRVFDDDGYPSDTVSIQITINPAYDLDIADNEGNLNANQMVLSGDLGETVHGFFQVINPNSDANNADPDAFGNADLNNIVYTVDTLWAPDHIQYITPDSVMINGAASLISGGSDLVDVYVHIPDGQPAGVYQATVRAVDGTAAVGDSFTLRVVVGTVEDIDIENTQLAGTGGAQDTLIQLDAMRVWNPSATSPNPDPDGPGNADLTNIQFSVTDLVSADNRVIPASNVLFVPQFIDTLVSGSFVDVAVKVRVAPGTHSGVYVGVINVHDDDGRPDDNVAVRVVITPEYDLDIAQNLVSLGQVALGDTGRGLFRVVNPNSQATNIDPDPFGNSDLDSVSFAVSDLVFTGNGIKDGAKADSVIRRYNVHIATITNLASGEGVDWPVSVIVPRGAVAGNYQGQVVAYAFAGTDTVSVDTFNLALMVKPVENIRVVQDTISATAGHGAVATATFTVRNYGNVDLSDIEFEPSDLVGGSHVIGASNVTFDPTSIPQLPVGQSETVTVHVNVPEGTYATDYYGFVTVTNGNVDDRVVVHITVTPSYDLDIVQRVLNLGHGDLGDVVEGYFRALNPNSAAMNADPDPFGNADIDSVTFTLRGDLTYTGKGLEKGGKTIVDSTIPASSVSIATIPGISSGAGIDWPVRVTIPANVLAGTYAGDVIATAFAGGTAVSSDTLTIELTVNATPGVAAVEDTVNATVGHGAVASTSFKVANSGNVDLTGISFSVSNLVGSRMVISADQVTFEPATVALLPVNDTVTVTARVNVPYGTFADTYYGTVTINAGSASASLTLQVTVTPSYDLDIADNEMNLVGNTMTYTANVGDTVSGLHFKVVNPNTAEMNVDPDPFGNADLTGVSASVTDLVSAAGFTIPSTNVSVRNLATTIVSGGFSIGEVVVVVPADQVEGTYLGKVIVGDAASGVADTFDLQVTVLAHEVIDIPADSINLVGKEGEVLTGSFYVKNTGNTDVRGLHVKAVSDLVSTNGSIIPRTYISFTKSIIDSIARGDSASVDVRVDLPAHVYRGVYSGWISVASVSGTPSDSVLLVVDVKSEEVVSFSDNPVKGGSVRIGYTGDVGYRPTLKIMNMAADVVLSVKLPPITGNNDVYIWKLVNAAGKKVAPGLYIVVIKTKVNGIEKVYRSKLLIVR